MNLQEWNEVRNLTYTEFVAYLNNKYGRVQGNYYDLRPAGTLKKGKAGVRGYYIHHVKEDEVPNLCSQDVAAVNPIEYQQAENLVQADVLEHFFLHVLIAEEFGRTEDLYVGEGGVVWIATTINGKVESGEISGEVYKTWLQLINRFCTSSFIRQKHDLLPKDLLKKLLGQCKKVKYYADYLTAADNTKLFTWNINAFSELQTYLKVQKHRTAGLVICTGGGKTTTALEYLRVSNARGLILGPSNTIGTGWEGNPDNDKFNYTYMNYQTFQNDYKTIDYSKYDVIICDEMHHTEAPRWGEGLQYALDNSNVKIIGLTATPSQEQKQGVDKYFEGRLCWGLDLATGIKEGYIHPFDYISAIYKLEREAFEKYGEAGRQLLGRLDLELNKNPIHEILKTHMPKSKRKIIVFVQARDMIDEAKEIMLRYNPNFASEDYARTIYSGLDTDYIKEAKDWFDSDHDHDVALFTINMANEGAHFKNINTLVMFRKTNSATLYLQQLGRIVVTSNNPDPDGIVFDFTNNAQTLINKPQVVIKTIDMNSLLSDAEVLEEAEEVDSKMEDEQTILSIQEAIKAAALDDGMTKNKGKVVIYKDYTEDCAETLKALQEAQAQSNMNGQIYSQLSDILLEDPDFMDLWKELKTAMSGRLLISTKRGERNPEEKHKPRAKAESKDPNEIVTRQVVSATDAEKLAIVYRLLVRRAYAAGCIEFSEDINVAAKIVDQDRFDSICTRLGITHSDVIIKAMNNLRKITYIIAVALDK